MPEPSDRRMNRIRTALAANPMLVDTAIALGLTALALFAFAANAPDLGPANALNLTLVLLQTVPLIARRRFPGCGPANRGRGAVLAAADLPAGAVFNAGVGLLVALYTVGERLERCISLALRCSSPACWAASCSAERVPGRPAAFIQTEFFVAVAWYVGDASRIRRLYTGASRSRRGCWSGARGAGPAGDPRGAGADRPRAPRCGHPSRQRDRDPGRRRPCAPSTGGRTRRAARSRRSTPPVARRLTEMRRMLGMLGEAETPGPDARARPPGRPARAGARGRAVRSS